MTISEKTPFIQKELKKYGLDGLVCRLSVNILALTGYWPCNHSVAAVVPQNGKPVLVVPETEMDNAAAETDAHFLDLQPYPLENVVEFTNPAQSVSAALYGVLSKSGLLRAKIGIEKSFEDGATGRMFGDFKYPAEPTWQALKERFPGVEFVDATHEIMSLRMIKTPFEVERIRKAAAVACIGFDAAREALRPGMTEADLSAALEAAILSYGTGRNGARYSRGFSSVYSGVRSSLQWSHWACTSGKAIEQNDVVIIELGSVTDGYWADLTRCFCAGSPSEKTKKSFGIILEAQAAGIEAAKPGKPIGGIDRACRDIFLKYGYGYERCGHPCGHSTGFNYHEAPPVHQANQMPIEEGMVLCIEPGLYFPGEFGMRCEDMFYIASNGAVRLSEYPHNLES
ncbi:MAG: Xaa-Pro peptidase family protein [Synergistaceae bacterium]|jgi:Xaa-Pro dipeptidase|nr:Xaa-Pro peptidase family protein [Synergistaceae bacterium]